MPIFALSPAPVSPTRITFFPKAINSGSSAFTVFSGPPTMNSSCADSAPTFDPVTGASTNSAPLARTRAAKSSVASGAMVLESTTVTPGRSTDSTPPGPKSTLSTALVSATHIQTTSASFAASAGVAAVRAPSTLFGERFHTVTSCPAFTKFAAIGRPMIPNPKYAIFTRMPPFQKAKNLIKSQSANVASIYAERTIMESLMARAASNGAGCSTSEFVRKPASSAGW